MNGNNLKILRQARGYSQESLAKAVGAKRVTLCSWELDNRNPTISTIIKLAKVLNCSVDVLLQDDLLDARNIGNPNQRIEDTTSMIYSTSTNKKPYTGWLDVMELKKMSVLLHDAITEKPNDDDLIIPIAYCPGDDEDLENLTLSEWPWEVPCVIALPTILGNEFTPIVDGAIVLWWISCEELIWNLTSRIELDHMTGKAVYIAMKHLEEKSRCSNNDCA